MNSICDVCGQLEDNHTMGHEATCRGLDLKAGCDCSRREWPICEMPHELLVRAILATGATAKDVGRAIVNNS